MAEFLALLLTAVATAYLILRLVNTFQVIDHVEAWIRKRRPSFDGFSPTMLTFVICLSLLFGAMTFVKIAAWLFGWGSH